VVAHLLRRMIVTASRTALALIAAEEDVPLVVAHASHYKRPAPGLIGQMH
jgi:hypothetical protein